MMLTLAYQHLNLTINPFGELPAEVRATIAVIDSDLMINTLQPAFSRTNHILQLVGSHGRGKSSHLLALHQHHAHIPYLQIHPNEPPEYVMNHAEYQTSQGSHTLPASCFVDSIENLSLFERLRYYRRYSKMAVTTCHRLTHEMRLCGRHVTTITISQTNAQHLLDCFNRRIEYARRNKGELPWLTLQHIAMLQALFGDDIRAMERLLYKVYQHMQHQQLPYDHLTQLITDQCHSNVISL